MKKEMPLGTFEAKGKTCCNWCGNPVEGTQINKELLYTATGALQVLLANGFDGTEIVNKLRNVLSKTEGRHA